jgi:hypothetical protein
MLSDMFHANREAILDTLILTTVHNVHLILKYGSRLVWAVNRGCLLGSFTVFTFSIRNSNFFDLSIIEGTWVVEMRICCIKIDNVLVLHFNPCVEASAGTCFKIQIWIELLKKSKFHKFISKRRIISLTIALSFNRFGSILVTLFGFHPTAFSEFSNFFFRFSKFLSEFHWRDLSSPNEHLVHQNW